MTNSLFSLRALLTGLATVLLSFSAVAAEGGGTLMSAGTDIGDQASLQRGAQLFMNNCSGCHSLKFMRYSRMAEDLGLTQEEVMENLNLSGGSFGDHVEVAMPVEGGNKWFGKMAPDLSLIARVRGTDWIYTYLHSFYLDPTRPVGWNNTLFANAAMPNPLWEMQGQQHAVYAKREAGGGDPVVDHLQVATPGDQTPAQFDQTTRDITAFLEYVGEPAALKRQGMGVWVILFLAFFTFMAYLLKGEYWKDVH